MVVLCIYNVFCNPAKSVHSRPPDHALYDILACPLWQLGVASLLNDTGSRRSSRNKPAHHRSNGFEQHPIKSIDIHGCAPRIDLSTNSDIAGHQVSIKQLCRIPSVLKWSYRLEDARTVLITNATKYREHVSWLGLHR